jgi:hypothetical protein
MFFDLDTRAVFRVRRSSRSTPIYLAQCVALLHAVLVSLVVDAALAEEDHILSAPQSHDSDCLASGNRSCSAVLNADGLDNRSSPCLRR